MNETLVKFEQALAGVQRILLTTHVNPDGDAVGSTLAMRAILERAGKHAVVVMSDAVPEKYRFLVDHHLYRPGPGALDEELEAGRFEMVVFIDASERERVGPVLEFLPDWCTPGAVVVNIDHHVSNDRFGDVVLIDPGRASAAEIVHETVTHLGIDLTPSIATQLYAGVLTDTGRFSYSNTTVECLRTAAELVAAGADPTAIAERIYAERPLIFYRLLGRLLVHLETHHEGRTCLMILPAEVIAELYPEGGMDTEGIVDYTVQIGGVEVGAFLRQTGEGAWRASLRSRGRVNVREVAEAFAGGGHDSAAGCALTGDLEQIRKRLLDEIGKSLA